MTGAEEKKIGDGVGGQRRINDGAATARLQIEKEAETLNLTYQISLNKPSAGQAGV